MFATSHVQVSFGGLEAQQGLPKRLQDYVPLCATPYFYVDGNPQPLIEVLSKPLHEALPN